MASPAVSTLAHFLLGPPGRQRVYASQALLALVIYGLFALMQHGEVLLGLVELEASNRLTTAYLGGACIFYGLVRSGLSHRLSRDPALTMAQTVFAVIVISGSYAITGPARGAVMTLLVLVLTFAMFSLTPEQARRLALLAFAALVSTMLWKSRSEPLRYPPEVELIHAVWAAIVLGGTTVLAKRMSVMRSRLTAQKAELQTALEQISLLATRDELTGLFNRRHMGALLQQEHARQREHGAAMTLALIDIDLFKRINDTHGHHIGDAVLKNFAQAARSVLRPDDVLARWGGEEFLLMLPATTSAQASAVVDRLRGCVAQAGFDSIAPALSVTFSSGLAECGLTDAWEATIERADLAMYRAKTQGRNCTVLA